MHTLLMTIDGSKNDKRALEYALQFRKMHRPMMRGGPDDNQIPHCR